MSKQSQPVGILDQGDKTALKRTFNLTDKQARFLTEFASCGNVSEAARRSGTCRRAHYDYLQGGTQYKQAYQQALQSVGFRVVERMSERALEGDVVVSGGKIVLGEDGKPLKRYDTVLQIYLSKALAKLTDQPDPGRGNNQSGPVVNIILPETQQQPTIEVNERDN